MLVNCRVIDNGTHHSDRQQICAGLTLSDTSMEIKPGTHRARSASQGLFRFGLRRERIDWRLLHGVDLDKLVRLPCPAAD